MSQPSWAAWIEISAAAEAIAGGKLSQPSWAAWIEIPEGRSKFCCTLSQPSWAAWIEILAFLLDTLPAKVAALMGCVD